MKRLGFYLSLIVILTASACSKGGPPPTTPNGRVLVKELPAGVEGLELRDGALRVKDGYNFVSQEGGFTIVRISDGETVTSGGCGCRSTSGDCDPVLKGGIIVCEGGCTDCGLAVSMGEVQTELMLFSR